MTATFNPENEIPRRLRALGCSTIAFSHIYGKRSTAYLSAAFRGQGFLTGTESLEMYSLLDRMEALARALDPIPIDFSNGMLIKKILEGGPEFMRKVEQWNQFRSFEAGQVQQ